MGKKSANKFGPQQVPVAATVVPRPSLEKQLHTWEASFESASKVYQSFDMSMDIHVEQDWLRSVLERFQADGDTDLARWIERFADFSKELVKFKDRLHEESAERWEQANSLVAGIGAREQILAVQQDTFEAGKAAFDDAKAALVAEQAQLARRKSELLDAERSLKLREANAQAGFVEQNEQALRQLEERQHQLIKQQEGFLQDVQDEKRKLDSELAQAARRLAEIKYSCSEEESERIKRLDDREHEIKQSKMELDRARSRQDREWADIKSAEASLEHRVAAEIETERASHEHALAKLEQQRDNAWKKAEALKDKLSNMQELAQVLGERSAADILEELDVLKHDNVTLKRSFEQSDTSELQRELDYLRSSKADLERDLSVIRPELDECRRELSSKRVASTELEAVAREKRVLEQHKNTLTVHIDDLESRIDQLTNAQKTQTPFPAMSLMDAEREYRASMELESVPGLKQFAEELQHRIASAEKPVELFYPLEDIRLLLGGLAMSQLHVFQGISGTGKTSLAKAFAKAMGGFCTDIAVQAGWRDRDDLLGHYNAFERRFYEKDCLQALYKAQTPRWRDTCNVILLDEMNLSRPEQYFAEFLSALEKNNRDERLISLAETAMPNAPMMLREGRKILVPNNVWFIGTANHDETTNELADKTYDRAHVMTLPKQDHSFTIKHYDPASFSYTSLNKAFDEACNKHRQEVGDLLKWLSEDDLTARLEKDFGLGWGNRFEKQAKRFIPVIKAAGGSEGEALDHLLSTRVMRKGKVTGRYDVSLDALKTLQDALLSFWDASGLDGVPERCNQLLEVDIRRLEGVS
ncbi:AAA family ATPase [Pseudomonas sp. N040]|uniref:AAA family ATPase n=1 Tax=Pseudomonas sp. N040 TaxID=2785325 RepID=UPI0018A32253|nr:AAA family ATPase [Pseudomonas sp. N040]MBF7728606.1 AAA family ATPase [Pseudomonas sp. N040]MBW7012246.1 AAA family ATPase [Pseudomonas sp. N040]